MCKHLLTFLMMFFCSTTLFAQQGKTVSGSVSDATSGEPLVGATVQETGTSNGTVTDIDGNFKIVVNGSQLTISYVGYTTETVTVNSSGTYTVKLTSDNDINEIVVIGYGTQRKSDLTGSLASIGEKDIKNYATSNVSNLIAGKAAGVFVGTSSGQPGSDAVVRVRGLGTVNDNNPLYVVDGQFMDNISSINPADIERIEVLKDASACAIYGSRGSNGVILVTTKGGLAERTVVTLDAAVGIRSSYDAMDMMDSDQFYDFITTAYAKDAGFDKAKFTNLYKKGYNTDWWDEVTRNAFNQNYNLSIRTGSDKSRTALSLGYVDEKGAIIETDFNRLNVRLNSEYDINKYLTVGANLNLARMKKRDSGSLPSFDFIQKADPFTPVINPLVAPGLENYEYNKWAPTAYSFDPNPVSILKLNDRHNDMFNVFGNVFTKVHLTKDFFYRIQFSYERNHDTFYAFRPIYSAIFPDDMMGNRESKYNTQTEFTNNSATVANYLVEQRLNYNKEFGKHRLDAMVAMTYERNKAEGINAFKRAALGNDPIYRILSAQTTGDQTSGDKVTSSMLSYLGRVNYAYNDTYLTTVNFRADGSSHFAKGNKWGYFPSLSLGWRISNEKFFQESSAAYWIDNLKLRLGWGQNGNQRIDANAPLTLIGTNNEMQWYFGTGYSHGYIPTYQGNSDIKWETSQQTNIGIDATFFNNTLEISMDYYIKRTKDMLLNMPIPSFGAFPNSPFFNAGDLKNNGFEFVANYRNHVGEFNYFAALNFSSYTTKVTSLTQDYLTGAVSRTYVDGPIGRFWGWKQIGIFQNQNEIDAYVAADGSKIQPNAHPGDFKFAKLTDSGALNDDDRTFIGDPNPDLIFGFNLGFEYKGFDLSAAFQGTIGNDIYNLSKGTLAVAGWQNALADAYTKAWRQEGDNAMYPRISASNDNNNFRTSSFYVEDGSYLRLQNLQLGYSLPQTLMLKLKYISSCRFYLAAQNLFTITGYSGLDPDLGVNNPLDMGYDRTHYPSSRTFTFGVNLQF